MNGTKLLSSITDNLNEMGLARMSESLMNAYKSPDFLNKDRLELISEMVNDEYQIRISKKIESRLRHAGLLGSPETIDSCVDSIEREYKPNSIVSMLKNLDFIANGQNVCILGASDSGKTYLARALAIEACRFYKVEYHHCTRLLENVAALKSVDFVKYSRKIKALIKADLLVLDDFLLNSIMDEQELKVLFSILEGRIEAKASTVVCSQRQPESWTSMMMNDAVSADAILKRITRHYTVVINCRSDN